MSYFYNYLEKYKDKIVNIYIDMDGVVADYDVIDYAKHKMEKDVYLTKRPIKTSISILKEISNLVNVKLYILSVSKKDDQVEGKITWLSQNMPFIKEENINIISRESNNMKPSTELKKNFVKEKINNNQINIIIDDSHQVLDALCSLNMNIIPMHITSILD